MIDRDFMILWLHRFGEGGLEASPVTTEDDGEPVIYDSSEACFYSLDTIILNDDTYSTERLGFF
jgi:hypothetical protein